LPLGSCYTNLYINVEINIYFHVKKNQQKLNIADPAEEQCRCKNKVEYMMPRDPINSFSAKS